MNVIGVSHTIGSHPKRSKLSNNFSKSVTSDLAIILKIGVI
jgi:hypothetical protein